MVSLSVDQVDFGESNLNDAIAYFNENKSQIFVNFVQLIVKPLHEIEFFDVFHDGKGRAPFNAHLILQLVNSLPYYEPGITAEDHGVYVTRRYWWKLIFLIPEQVYNKGRLIPRLSSAASESTSHGSTNQIVRSMGYSVSPLMTELSDERLYQLIENMEEVIQLKINETEMVDWLPGVLDAIRLVCRLPFDFNLGAREIEVERNFNIRMTEPCVCLFRALFGDGGQEAPMGDLKTQELTIESSPTLNPDICITGYNGQQVIIELKDPKLLIDQSIAGPNTLNQLFETSRGQCIFKQVLSYCIQSRTDHVFLSTGESTLLFLIEKPSLKDRLRKRGTFNYDTKFVNTKIVYIKNTSLFKEDVMKSFGMRCHSRTLIMAMMMRKSRFLTNMTGAGLDELFVTLQENSETRQAGNARKQQRADTSSGDISHLKSARTQGGFTDALGDILQTIESIASSSSIAGSSGVIEVDYQGLEKNIMQAGNGPLTEVFWISKKLFIEAFCEEEEIRQEIEQFSCENVVIKLYSEEYTRNCFLKNYRTILNPDAGIYNAVTFREYVLNGIVNEVIANCLIADYNIDREETDRILVPRLITYGLMNDVDEELQTKNKAFFLAFEKLDGSDPTEGDHMKDVRSSVQKLHNDLQICHNDIRVSNLIRSNGKTYLLDFNRSTISPENRAYFEEDDLELNKTEWTISTLKKIALEKERSGGPA